MLGKTVFTSMLLGAMVAPAVADTPAPGGVLQQAGLGESAGYARPGVWEVGGSAGLMIAPDVRDINLSPSLGWFVADNLELSGIMSVSNVKARDQSATVWTALVEPSYHIPVNRTTFAFLGMGIGAAYERHLGTGIAVAPHLGMNFLVGRSSILTPSLSYEYTTQTHASSDMDNMTLLSVSQALRINVGYTAMW
jgi:hypothetical protein